MPIELLDKKIIHQYVSPKHRHYLEGMVIFDQLPSTNTYLTDLTKTKNNSTSICFSEEQTAGKGRLGRQWVSPFGQNIYLSLLWPFTKKSHELGSLSLAAAVAVVQTLHHYNIKNDIALKWPNDVLWQNRKIAGILIEQTGNKTVIGVGLNVNMQASDANLIEQPWCSVAHIINAIPKKNKLAGLLLNELLETMIKYQEYGLNPFVKKWQQLDITRGKKVIITIQETKISGTSLGINEHGHLLLSTTKHQIIPFTAGEVSLSFSK
jgi:BirA family transcriptional regulator, biotin operon repressor / biotin---[acetyl-CoA-carboxylase] ligase